jgi:hypothetical protein
MNPLMWLEVPWRSSHRALRWLSAAVFVLCSAGALAMGMFGGEHQRWVGALSIYGFGLVYLWAFFMSTCLLLAIDTRQLRVPGIQRQIVAGLLLYGVLSIGVPACILGASGLPAWNGAALLCTISAGGLMFALMPRFVAVFIGMLPSLLMAVWRRFELPGVTDPRFAHWAWFVALLLLAAVILRWRQLLLAGPNTSMGWATPLVIQFRNSTWAQWNNLSDSRQLRQRPDWLQPGLDLGNAGPANPRKAVRVALGGWYLPQTRRSLLKQWAMAAFIIVVPGLASTLLVRLGHPGNHANVAMKGALLGAFGSLTLMAAPMIALLTMVWISKRWQRVNAELPLLALFPGLGNADEAKRTVLRAGLRLPLMLHGLLIVLVLAAMLLWTGHLQLLGFVLLAQLGTATVTLAFVLNIFGGCALKTAATSVILGLVFVLTVLSLMLPALAQSDHPSWWAAPLLAPLLFAWLLLMAGMVWLSRRGWRHLQQLPHAFVMR